MPNARRKSKSVAGRNRIDPSSNSRAEKLTPATRNQGSRTSHNEGPSFSLQTSVPLPRAFFDRDPRVVARELLGKVLVRRRGQHVLAGRIVETEAYLGADDPAAHSAAGRTLRNAVLFGPPGYAYIYFIYGNHFCLNVSCLGDGEPGGVLFRALEPLAGLSDMARFRHLDLSLESSLVSSRVSQRIRVPHPELREGWDSIPLSKLKSLTSGPGRLAQAFAITRIRDNGKDMTSPRTSDLYIVQDDLKPGRILEGPRVGITKAVEHPLRYVLANNPFVSGKLIR
jgi:DNA-3-methyladenine glycosylase